MAVGRFGGFLWDTARSARDVRTWLPLTVGQMRRIGVQSVPIALFIAVFTGIVLALLSSYAFTQAVPLYFVGTFVGKAMLLELSPVLVGLALAGRVGANVAAELGTMRVTEQIDALETLATNPVKFLIVPRFISGCIMLPALVVITDIVGIVGGYFVTVNLLDASSRTYMKATWDFLEAQDIYSGLIKAAFFGAAFTLISCYKGFYTKGGAEGVGRATTGAVVYSSMAILISDYFLSAWLF